MKKTIISVVLAAALIIGSVLPVMAIEPLPQGGYMYEGELTIQWVNNDVKSKPEAVKARINICVDPSWTHRRIDVEFVQGDKQYTLFVIEDDDTSLSVINLSTKEEEKLGTGSFSYNDIKDKMMVKGSIKSYSGDLILNILSSNLKEVIFPEFATFQSKDGLATFTYKAKFGALSVQKPSGTLRYYELTHIGYNLLSFEKSSVSKVRLTYSYVRYNGDSVGAEELDSHSCTATYDVEKDIIALEIPGLKIRKTLYRVPAIEKVFTKSEAVLLIDAAVKEMKSGQDSLIITAKGFTKADKSALTKLNSLANEKKIKLTVCFEQNQEMQRSFYTDKSFQSKIYVDTSVVQEDLDLNVYAGSNAIENAINRQYDFKEGEYGRIFAISNNATNKNIPLRVTVRLLRDYYVWGAEELLQPTIYKYTKETNTIQKISNPNLKVDLEKLLATFDIATGGDYIYCYGELIKKK